MNAPREFNRSTPKKSDFKRKVLANAIASYALFGFSGLAVAQEDDRPENSQLVEEVIVTGVRGAQQSAINTKRMASSIVDGISAEDIGKLPDTTITDSLQRITGVQIQRSAGEGSSLSVRGMQQVSVMLNGEQFLAAGNLASAQPNFEDVPAQLLRAATVYKTLDVSNAQSGITGTIDIETFRPFDFKDGFSAAGGIDVSTGEISGEVDPTYNVLINWRSEDIGVMLSGVTGVKNLANDYAGRASGDPAAKQMGPGSPYNNQWVVTNGHGFEFFNAADERNRDGLNAALQADLGAGLELVVEGFYTEAKQYQRRVGLNISNRWQGQETTRPSLWHPRYSDGSAWSGATVAAPVGHSDMIAGGDGRQWIIPNEYSVQPLWIYSLTSNRIIDTDSKNFNVELSFDNGSALTGTLRAIHASASNNQLFPTAQGGINSFRGDTVQQLDGHFYPDEIIEEYGLTLDPDRLGDVGVDGGRFVLPNPLGYDEDPILGLKTGGFNYHWSGFDQPIAGGLTTGGQEASLADYMGNRDSWIMEGLQLEINSNQESDLTAFSFEGNYAFDDLFITDVDFGVRAGDRRIDVENYDYWAQFYVGSDTRITGPEFPNANNVVGCYAQWRSIDQKFDGGGSGAECSAGERLVGAENDMSSFTPYWILPPQSLDYHGQDLEFVTDLGDYVDGIPGFWAVDPHSFDDAVPFNERAFGDIKPIINPATSYTIDLKETSGYVKGNFDVGIVEGNLGVRIIDTEITASVYQTTGVTRTNGGSVYYTGRETQSKSETYVLPSLNMAITPVDNLIVRVAAAKNKMELDLYRYGSSFQVFTGPDPDDATQRIPSGWNSQGNINLDPWMTKNYDISVEYYIGDTSMLSAGAYLVEIDSFVEAQSSTIDLEYQGETYSITGTGPVQRQGGEVKGIELSSKLALSDFIDSDNIFAGFGVDANYTYSPSERPGEATDVTGEYYPFANNSEHTYNLILWYQQDRLQARIALNGRSERFDRDFDGDFGYATYTPSSTYLDASISYDVLDDVTVYLQGANLTSTDYEQVYRLADGVEHQAFVYDNEARYSLGIRAKF